MFGFSSKEEFEWWKEDNKGKFYGICAAAGIAVFALVMVVASLLKPKEVEEIVEEDVITEIEVGGFDVDEAIEEKQRTAEEERNERYGEVFSFAQYSTTRENAHGGLFVTVVDGEDKFVLYLPDGGGLSEETWETMFLDHGIFALRGTFEDIDPDVTRSWEEEDYLSTVLLFKDSEFNKTTAKAYEAHMQELKVALGYKKNEKEENIADDDWGSIQSDMNSWFANYLTTIDTNGKEITVPEEDVEGEEGDATPIPMETEEDKETLQVVSIIDAYIEENPLPVYDNIKVVSTPIYICEKDGIPYGELSENSFWAYRSTYWGAYFLEAHDELLNEGDVVSIVDRGYQDGEFYALTKSVNFSLRNDVRGEELVVWLRYDNGTQEFYYYPSSMWSTDNSDYTREYYTVPVTSGVTYFGYFLIGKRYPLEIEVGGFETELPEKNSWDDGIFSINEVICYNREDIYGEESILRLSEFVLSDGPLELPENVSYIVNDTEYTVDMTEVNEGMMLQGFKPGDEIFVDRAHVNVISWRVL